MAVMYPVPVIPGYKYAFGLVQDGAPPSYTVTWQEGPYGGTEDLTVASSGVFRMGILSQKHLATVIQFALGGED